MRKGGAGLGGGRLVLIVLIGMIGAEIAGRYCYDSVEDVQCFHVVGMPVGGENNRSRDDFP